MIAVIGCGNPNRSDDGAGPAVVGALLARGFARSAVKLLDAGTDGIAVDVCGAWLPSADPGRRLPLRLAAGRDI